jgi:hypothetical protein
MIFKPYIYCNLYRTKGLSRYLPQIPITESAGPLKLKPLDISVDTLSPWAVHNPIISPCSQYLYEFNTVNKSESETPLLKSVVYTAVQGSVTLLVVAEGSAAAVFVSSLGLQAIMHQHVIISTKMYCFILLYFDLEEMNIPTG